jgi:hypothetical protein
MWLNLKAFYAPLANAKRSELFLSSIAGVLQFVVWMSFLMIGAKNGRDMAGLLRSVFMGYSVWLAYLGGVGVFLFSVIAVYLALRGYRWHSFILISSNYLYGLIQFFKTEPKIDNSELFSSQSLGHFSDPIVWIINLLPLFLLHALYFRALKR